MPQHLRRHREAIRGWSILQFIVARQEQWMYDITRYIAIYDTFWSKLGLWYPALKSINIKVPSLFISYLAAQRLVWLHDRCLRGAYTSNDHRSQHFNTPQRPYSNGLYERSCNQGFKLLWVNCILWIKKQTWVYLPDFHDIYLWKWQFCKSC